MRKEIIHAETAPKAIGPYSQAVKAGGVVYCSGQIPLDPSTMQVLDGGVGEQTRRVLANLEAVLVSAGSSLSLVVKTTVYLRDMNDFAEMNEAYGEFFREEAPARATVEAARLPKDVSVEIDCIALAD